MEVEGSSAPTMSYYCCSQLFLPSQVNLLSKYKVFIEETIIKLGEDWRIEANLLINEILSTHATAQVDFNLFNEFLAAFLPLRLRQEYHHNTENETLQAFLQSISVSFRPMKKIEQSLTFKTLSLGFCITANDVWQHTFQHPVSKESHCLYFKPFLRREGGNQWSEEPKELEEHVQREMTEYHLKKRCALGQTVVLGGFVTEIHEREGEGKRLIKIHSDFYELAAIVWVVFSLKTFFSLTQDAYLRYFLLQVGSEWKDQLKTPLFKMHAILQLQWHKINKDYTIALHDDNKVFITLIDRVRVCIQTEWERTLNLIISLK